MNRERRHGGRFGELLGRAGAREGVPEAARRKDLVLTYLAAKFDLGREHREAEVNEVLRTFITLNDPALLRRDLFEFGLLGWYRNGSVYGRIGAGEAA